jgi:GxxExxY protein
MDTNEKQINTNVGELGLLHGELCYEIQGCMYNVANKYGKGLKEIIYQKALEEELVIKSIPFESQKRINIYSVETGKVLGTYVPDLLVKNLVIIEIKATTFSTKQDEQQQLLYLRASKYEVGYLVNFSTPKLYIKRSIYTNDRKPFLHSISVN